MDKSTKKLLSGSVVYFIGNALTQLISLLLMRFVTGNISPEEYGFFNLVATVSNLAIPFVTVQIADAVFKFVLKSESEKEKKEYFSICFMVSFVSIVLIYGIVFGISLFVEVPHTFLVATYVASYAMVSIYHKITRSLNKNKVFVTGNLIKTFIFLTLEIVLISAMDMGIEALLLAHIISLAFALIYTEIRIRALRYFSFKSLNILSFKAMLRFSVPLIPNAVFWWLTSSVNSVIISARLGMNTNGIYSVSSKFTSVLNMVTGVLNMSWQDTAVADYGKQGFKEFLTKTFNTFVKLIFSAIAVLIPLISLVLPYMIDPTYYDAIPYTPFLIIASGISTMSGFMAQIFTGKGKTKTILITSIFGMITNILVIFVLVDKIGLWAAVWGSVAADAVLLVSRAILARKDFAKGIAFVSFIVVIIMNVISVVLYLNAGVVYNAVWFVISAIIAVILNWQFIKDMISLLFGKFIKKKNVVKDKE